MAYNQQLSVLGQVAPATTGTAGQVLVSAGSSASSYWASAIPVSAYSAQFNGSSYLNAPSNAVFALGTGDFTAEAWVYTTSISSTVQQFVIDVGGYGGFGFGIYSNKIHIAQTGVADLTDFATTLTNNTWYHIALVRSSGSTKAYVNGIQQGTAYTDSTSYTASGITTIGSHYDGTIKLTGYISNARIVKGLAIYTGTFTVPTSPLGTSQAAGTNIAAVTPSQVSLLTCNGPGITDSSPNAFTLINTTNVVTSQFAPFSSFSAISRSATQTQTILTSGSGTYYTPSGVAWLRIRMVGGGGGGGGGSTTGSPGSGGSNGANTTFGSSFLTAGYGLGALTGSIYMVAGGTASIGSGATGITITGGSGTSAAYTAYPLSGSGGNSPFGGGGGGGGPTGGSLYAGGAGSTNSGAGGGGGHSASGSVVWAGHGGSAGGYVEAYISNPAASYAYIVGAAGGGGAAGNAGGSNGGAGGSGLIIVEENYAVNVSSSNYTASYLIVAGGGSGGGYGGGGGAGGLLTGLASLIPSINYSITVGSGGAASATTTNGNPGNNSSLFGLSGGTITAIGGGYGGGNAGTSSGQTGGNGGSGGGASHGASTSVATTGGSGTSGQGNAGGTGLNGNGSSYGEGGGGGAGAVGGNYAGTAGGAGGIGIASTITGSSVYYAGGGGGFGGGSSGAGGTGGGGAGGSTSPVAGTVNTGGGGGGGGGAAGGAAGGSGVVILSIPTSNYTGITTGSPTVTTSGSYKILTFTASGSYTA